MILIAWLGFLRRTEASVEDPDILEEVIAESRAMVGLAKAQEIYRQKYLAQESMLKDGTFTRAIVTAMSKMPSARRFFVGDSFQCFKIRQLRHKKALADIVEDPESLATSWLVHAEDCDSARVEQRND